MSSISETNKIIQKLLETILEISKTVLNSPMFLDHQYNKYYMENMQELQQKTNEYLNKLEELQKHHNLINVGLFNSFNQFFQQQTTLITQTANMFSLVNFNSQVMLLTVKLIPQVSEVVKYIGQAITNLQTLQDKTMEQFGVIAENSPSFYFEKMLTDLLNSLPNMIKSYQLFTDTLKGTMKDYDPSHDRSQKSKSFTPYKSGHKFKAGNKSAKKSPAKSSRRITKHRKKTKKK